MTPALSPLVGRVEELLVFERALDTLDVGRASMVELTGEPGMGKTRLLAEACALAEARGFLILSGRVGEFERDVPFGVLVEALDDYVGSLEPARLEAELGPEHLAELASVFPSLASAGAATRATAGGERYRMHRAVHALVDALADPRPLVLALDDLHWADQASLDVLGYLLHKPPVRPVLLALAYRHRQAPGGVLTTLARASPALAPERVELEQLTAADADALLENDVPRRERGRLYTDSGGNPFYLLALARAGHSTRDASTLLAADAEELPPPVRAALLAELEAVSPDAGEVVRAAAVTGDSFELELVAEVAELPESDVLSMLDELVACDVLRPTAAPRRFRFRHPLVRRVAYVSSPPGWRLGAHARAADALARSGAPASARAAHVERSAAVGDTEGIALLVDAGRETASRAPATAARWFEAALRLLPPDEQGPRRIELLAAAAGTYATAGRLEKSRAVLDEALSLPGPIEPSLHTRLVIDCARVDNLLGLHDDARALLSDALAHHGDRADHETAELQLELALVGFYQGDYDAMATAAGPALAAGRLLGDHVLHAAALAVLALAEYGPGRLAAADALCADAATVLDGLSDDELDGRLDAIFFLGHCEYCLGHHEQAAEHLERGLSIARATGEEWIIPLLELSAATARFYQGRPAETAELAEAAYETARMLANHQFEAMALFVHSVAMLVQGDVPGATSLAEQAVATAGQLGSMVSALAGAHLAEAMLESGDAEGCRELLLAAAGGPGLELIERAGRSRYYEILVRAELALGRVEAAHEWLDRGQETLTGAALDLRRSELMMARAEILLAESNAEGALEAASSSVDAADAARIPIAAARARIVYGRALAASGARDEAVSELESAAGALAACGAGRYEVEAIRELRRLGRRVTRAVVPSSGSLPLSRRELEVAELVAAGKTNREIAAELFLSENTIETHLRRIFIKLGVSSRAAVAAAVERHR